jgi:hypothetical protein
MEQITEIAHKCLYRLHYALRPLLSGNVILASLPI